jgi:hypothetical protein
MDLVAPSPVNWPRSDLVGREAELAIAPGARPFVRASLLPGQEDSEFAMLNASDPHGR